MRIAPVLRRGLRPGAASLLAAAALLLMPTVAGAWPVCVERTAPVPISISEVGRSQDDRVITLTVASGAMAGDQTVTVLLPRGFKPGGKTRYPVLYLLHGAGGDPRTYLDDYPLMDLVGDRPWIVVMPQGSGPDAEGQRRNGGYADWFGVKEGGVGPAFGWETYHIRELVPFIDRAFPTLASPAGRAIAGISMGGGGAFKYAAEYPGTFGYAGSFSGSLYPELPEAQATQTQDCKFGDPASEEVVWRDNDPTVLAANLRGVRLFVRSGDGTPGPFDSPTQPSDPIEAAVWQQRLLTEYGAGKMALAFHRAAADAGISVDFEMYPGSHSSPYWARELPEFFSWLGQAMKHPTKDRRSFTVKSAHSWFTAWGWTFDVGRSVREFLYVAVKGEKRLRLTGSGRVSIETAPVFEPRASYRVRGAKGRTALRADREGRLSFKVALGASHDQQQTSFETEPPADWKTTRVRILK